MRHSRLLGAFTFVVAMLALSPSRGDYRDGLHGSVCVGKTPADAARLEEDQWGVRNASTTDPATVVCPVGYMTDGGAFRATVWHDDPSQVANCFFFVADNAGFYVFQAFFNPGAFIYVDNPTTNQIIVPPMTGYVFLQCQLPAAVGSASAWVASLRMDD